MVNNEHDDPETNKPVESTRAAEAARSAPPMPIGDETLMVVLLRAGEEIAVATADDTRDAVRVTCKMLLDQPELRLGDQVCIMRV